jgi:ATP-dependent exoDNAse (exonuclease V) beta subunit
MGFPLNEAQRRAAGYLWGPLLINAGAGTGKTRTITERFANAIVPGAVEGWEPTTVERLLAITFTDKAAGELAERARRALRAHGEQEQARRVDAAWLSTIHGFCSRLLRRHALEAGLDPNFGVADSVVAGALRERAFEVAAARALTTEAGMQLFAAWEFSGVYDAVRAVAARLRALDIPATELIIDDPPGVSLLLREALDLFGSTKESLCSCKDTKTTVRHGERCGEIAEQVEQLMVATIPEPDLAAELWRLLAGYGKSGRLAADAQETMRAFAERRAALTASAADVLAYPLACELAGIIDSYLGEYAREKQARALLDFDDLQAEVVTLARDHPRIRERYRAQFLAVMVDEFQDTDELQLRLIREFAGDRLCTVGDELQSIFRFRGADIDVYRAHVDAMTAQGALRVDLVTNYRSHPSIIGFVNGLFGHEELFGAGLIVLAHGRDEPVPPVLDDREPRIEFVLVDKVGQADGPARSAEADAIGRRFAELRDEQGIPASDMVILLRSYRHAGAYVSALENRGFMTAVVGGSRFFGLPEVEMLRAFLRVLANPHDDEALLVVLVSPMSAVSDDTLLRLRSSAQHGRAPGGLWGALCDAGSEVLPEQADALGQIRAAIEASRARVGNEPLSRIMLRALEMTDTDLALFARADGVAAYANVLKLARMADAFETEAGAGPAAFGAHLDMKERLGEHETPATVADEASGAVRLMSIHASKGLEFPVVAVPELGATLRSDSRFAMISRTPKGPRLALRLPQSWAPKDPETTRTTAFMGALESEKNAEIEEAKRLLYVAATRAQEVLVLSGSANLGKPAEQDNPLGWVRRACGEAFAISASDGRSIRELPWGGAAAVSLYGAAEDVEAPALAGGPAPAPPSPRPGHRAPDLPADMTPEPLHRVAAPQKLSYSAIGLYEDCPMRYWAERVVGISATARERPGDALSFGTAVHAALQLSGPSLVHPADERLVAIARLHRLDEPLTRRLHDTIATVLGSDIAEEIRRFARVRPEWPFAVGVPTASDPAFLLVGAIDLYARDGGRALVLDYKSGQSGAAFELEDRYRTQARCYAYVALRDGAQTAEVIFARPEVVGPEGIERVRYKFDAAMREEIEQDLLGVWRLMGENRFEPLDCWNEHLCGSCPIADGVCPLRRPPR